MLPDALSSAQEQAALGCIVLTLSYHFSYVSLSYTPIFIFLFSFFFLYFIPSCSAFSYFSLSYLFSSTTSLHLLLILLSLYNHKPLSFFLFLRITVFLNIIICFKFFRLPLLFILCLLMPLVLLICFLTRIYLHDLLLFVMFHLLVRPYYSFFVIWYTFITSPSLYSLYHEVTNLIVLVSIRSSSIFINVAVCVKNLLLTIACFVWAPIIVTTLTYFVPSCWFKISSFHDLILKCPKRNFMPYFERRWSNTFSDST